MTTQEIIELAGHRDVPPWVMKLVADCVAKSVDGMVMMTHDEFKSVWDKAQAEEREACAKVCEEWDSGFASDPDVKEIATAIRARGQQ